MKAIDFLTETAHLGASDLFIVAGRPLSYKKDGKIVLHPENSTMQDIVVDSSHDFAILGVAKGLMRNRIF